MHEDHIVTEVRKARQEILESYGMDIEAYLRDCMKRQWESGHTVVSPKRKEPQQGTSRNAYPPRGQA